MHFYFGNIQHWGKCCDPCVLCARSLESGWSVQDCSKGHFQWMSLLTGNLIFRSDAAQERGFSNQNPEAGKMLPVGPDQRSCECCPSLFQWELLGDNVQQRTHYSAVFSNCTLSGKFQKASRNLMHFIYACIYQWSVPMEHGLKKSTEKSKVNFSYWFNVQTSG